MPLRLAGLALLAILACGVSLLAGGSSIDPGALWNALLHPHSGGDITTIFWQLRFPRVVIAAAVGAALGTAGALLQGMLRNPLVDPYLTGVSAGATAAVAIAILIGIAAPLLPALGFIAGLATAVLVGALARRGSGVDANRLILAGVSLSALFSSIVTVAIERADSFNAAQQILGWIAGSMAGRGWSDLLYCAPYFAIGGVLAIVAVPSLNALRVGDTRARTIGVNVERAQWVILSSASMLAAASVVLAGLIGFVGLIVPHLARRIVGSDVRVTLPACALLGASLCAIADAIARTVVAPSELPIGVLLAFIGVPTFLYMYLHMENR